MSEMLWFCFNVLIYILIFIAFIMIYFLIDWTTLRKYWLIEKIPGPKGMFYFGNAYELKDLPVEDIKTWLESKLKPYNRMARLWYLGKPFVFLMQPEDIKVVLGSKQHITKGIEYDPIRLWLNTGLLNSTGNKWFSRRKILTPAFHFKILEDNLTTINKNGQILAKKIEALNGQDASLKSLMSLCTLDIIFSTSMGVDINAQSQASQDYVKNIERISELITYKLIRPHFYKDWIFALSSTGREFYKIVKFLHAFSFSIINQRKANYNESSVRGKDVNLNVPEGGKIRRALLDTLLEIEHLNPGTLSDVDIREEVDTFMFEGHDTTSMALVFSFFNIARFPEIQEKVYNELYDIFGDDNREATTNDLSRMTYTEKVIKESLRMFPSVPYISRNLDKDLILGDGLKIPASTNVVIPIFLIHRNDKLWTDPHKFDPERFSEDQIQERHPYSYIPFSAGSRNCIGQKFAMMEMKVIVSTILRSYKVIPVTKEGDIQFLLEMILRTNKDILCQFVPR